MPEYKYATLAVHAGQHPDPQTGAVNVPLYLSSTFELVGIGADRGWDYSRAGNPTRDRLEVALAALEGGTSGHAFTTGMAAIAGLVAMLRAGDHIVCSRDVYAGTVRLFDQIISGYGIEIEYVDSSDLAAVEKAMKPNTKLVHIETPSNPLMVLTDIAGVVKIAHATKYLNGHSDGLGGVLIGTKPEHKERFLLIQKAAGGVMSPFECFLVLRGIKTLPVRIKQHEENGRAVAEFMSTHPKVSKLAYPGLKSHPQYDLAVKQQRGFGSMMSFELKSRAEAERFLKAIKIFLNAESLGGVESLASHSATTTHGSVSEEVRRKMGINEGRIRLSIGIEDKEDLIADLDQALKAV
jgi:cystathionine beta-lyase/cystathionine gamma-synthase